MTSGDSMNQPVTFLVVAALLVLVAVVAFLVRGERSSRQVGVLSGSDAPGLSAPSDESIKANALFEAAFEETMMRQPMFQTELGIKTDYDKWDDLSAKHADETIEIIRRQLATLRETIDYSKLDEKTKLSYDLFVQDAGNRLAKDRYRYHDYPVNQMFGWQARVPSFLINYHRVGSVEDAVAYIERLQNVPQLFEQLIEGLEVRADLGVIPPKFVFPRVISVSQNVITGKPFDASGDDSTILSDFKSKVNALAIDDNQKSDLMQRANEALLTYVGPAYERLTAYLTELETRATTDDGVWKLPDGEAYYAHRLRDMTTTDLTAKEINDIGVAEVARIHSAMRGIMERVGFDGSLLDFFEFMRKDPQFYYDDTKEGKQAYLDRATEIIETMKGRLDELFTIKPRTPIVVKAVEPFREKSAGGAFYQRPSPDGSRPGIYYANLYKMANMPKYEMEALAYHEGIPGHHMQLAIAVELEDVPTFRKYLHPTANIEGWALYCELTPKEIGLYQDPYSDFGRLSAELLRACRLVVDTAIHDQKWTRERAIDYLMVNMPSSHDEAVKAIERYIVMPGQATAYKIGMLKIMELREKAKAQLGDRFDVRAYHDLILANGPVPLEVLERLVNDWIATQSL